MVTLTPDMVGTSLIITYISLGVTMLITFYQLWLNYKQAKVNNQMDKVINVLEQIRDKKK